MLCASSLAIKRRLHFSGDIKRRSILLGTVKAWFSWGTGHVEVHCMCVEVSITYRFISLATLGRSILIRTVKAWFSWGTLKSTGSCKDSVILISMLQRQKKKQMIKRLIILLNEEIHLQTMC